MYRLGAVAVALLVVVGLTACSLRMQPGERGRPAPPLPAVSMPKPPKPPRIYRLGHLDTLVQLPGRVLSLYPAPRRVYEQLPEPTWLVPAEDSAAEEEIDLAVEERKRLVHAGTRVQRVGKVLWLRPTAAPAVRLLDNPIEDEEKNIGYEYLAALPEIHQWLISVHLYEGGYYLLVNQRTGQRTRVWSPPSVAPDGQHFVCGNSDVLARFEPSGLQVWAVDGATLRLLWQRQTEWGVSGPRWLNNRTILFEQDFFDNGDVDTRVVRMAVVP